MDWYLEVVKKYAVFSGRARRREYWMFTLINFLVIFVLGFIAAFTGDINGSVSELAVVVAIGYYIGIILPALGVSIRRLHDTGRSGWWLLIVLVPFVGSILVLVFMALDSQPGPNQYGSNPKEIAFSS
jgi:uncharacterized membrane protein YhaH (DUF805 family)